MPRPQGIGRAPDGSWGWVIVCCSFMNHLLLEGMVRSFGLVYLQLVTRYNSSATLITWLHAAFQGMQQMGVGPFLGALVERFTCRKLVVCGGLMYGLAYIISAFAPNLYFLYFSYSLLGGIGSGLIYSPIVIIVNDYFDQKRGRAMGLAALGTAAGTFAIPYMIHGLFHRYGYTGCMMLLGAIAFNNIIFALLYRPLPAARTTIQTLTQNLSEDKAEHNISTDLNCYTRDRGMSVNSDVVHPAVSRLRQEERPYNSVGSLDTKSNDITSCRRQDSFRMAFHNSRSLNRVIRAHFSNQISLSRLDLKGSVAQVNEQDSQTVTDRSSSVVSFKEKLSVMKSGSLLLYCLMLFTIPSANTAVFVYLPGMAAEKGMSESRATFLVSIIGAANAVGTLVTGLMFDVPLVSRHRRCFHSLLGLLLGGMVVAMAVIVDFFGMVTVAAGYGFLLAGVMGQRATALSQYVSHDKLHFAFGFVMVFQGLGNLVGLTIQGLLKDEYHTYGPCFLYGGCMVGLASLSLVIDYLIRILHSSHRKQAQKGIIVLETVVNKETES